MKLRERDEPLDPQVERELDAVDRALSGRDVHPDLADLGELATLIAEERPEPESEWSAESDRLAAARFREGGSSARRSAFGRLKATRFLAPAGALATLVVVVIGVSTLSNQATDDFSESNSATGDAVSLAPAEDSRTLDAGAAEQGVSSAEIAPLPDDLATSPPFPGDEGKIAPGTEKRQVERDVSLTLSTRPEGVRDVSDEAIAITRSLGGIVASSQVSSSGQEASATLQLTIPSRNLDAALDRLTDLANVKSLDESTLDITRPYVSAQDQLRDAEAERRSLLEALGNASTDAEATALRLQIADARRAISAAEAAFENIARRARLSGISLSIVGDPNMEDDRSIGDWFDDAVSVLRDVAGVLLITAAIVVPLGILVGLGWLIVAGMRRRRRDRALD